MGEKQKRDSCFFINKYYLFIICFLTSNSHAFTSTKISCGQSLLTETAVSTLAAMVCTLNSANKTEKNPMTKENGVFHAHRIEITRVNEGFFVEGECSIQKKITESGVIQLQLGGKLKLKISRAGFSKCNPKLSGEVGGRTVDIVFQDLLDVETESSVVRMLKSIQIGSNLMDWVNSDRSTPWLRDGTASTEMGFQSDELDFSKVHLHMVGSRAWAAMESLRWDFVVSGDRSGESVNLSNDVSRNLLIRMSNIVDGPTGDTIKEMSYSYPEAQNVFISDSYGGYLVIEGCSLLVFDGALFSPRLMSVEKCQKRLHPYPGDNSYW
ncbi:MAG: hypothetical protein K1X29_04825 [Bdellovibrionales bacterium]|nr:hypothetical protein [Bdellovibrionales bacterium]